MLCSLRFDPKMLIKLSQTRSSDRRSSDSTHEKENAQNSPTPCLPSTVRKEPSSIRYRFTPRAPTASIAYFLGHFVRDPSPLGPYRS
jgi:hypothetical protein